MVKLGSFIFGEGPAAPADLTDPPGPSGCYEYMCLPEPELIVISEADNAAVQIRESQNRGRDPACYKKLGTCRQSGLICGGAFLRSGRPRGPGKAFKNVGGFARV